MEEHSIKGKVCIVTGASYGIGRATAAGLAALGATVVMVSRAGGGGAPAAEDIRKSTGNQSVAFLPCDLSSHQSIRDFTIAFTEGYKRLNILVNNAGGIYSPRRETVDGLEMTFGFNHLSPFLLTNLLMPLLKASAPSRIVNVSSGAQGGGIINFDDLQGKRAYSPINAYSQSKLANVLFTYELSRRFAPDGITSNVLHPGTVRTGFGNGTTNGFLGFFIKIIQPLLLTPEQGAETSIYLASSPEVEGVTGKYFIKKKATESAPASYDTAVAGRLWNISEELAGLRPTAVKS